MFEILYLMGLISIVLLGMSIIPITISIIIFVGYLTDKLTKKEMKIMLRKIWS